MAEMIERVIQSAASSPTVIFFIRVGVNIGKDLLHMSLRFMIIFSVYYNFLFLSGIHRFLLGIEKHPHGAVAAG